MSEYWRLELEKGDLKKISNSELKSKIMRWRSDKESKTTLAVYSQFKKEISEEAGMENWNQDHPERYSNFCGIYIKFQVYGKWPLTW